MTTIQFFLFELYYIVICNTSNNDGNFYVIMPLLHDCITDVILNSEKVIFINYVNSVFMKLVHQLLLNQETAVSFWKNIMEMSSYFGLYFC